MFSVCAFDSATLTKAVLSSPLNLFTDCVEMSYMKISFSSSLALGFLKGAPGNGLIREKEEGFKFHSLGH